ncbi:MAG: hypothetical protein WKI50_05440 [Aquificaceae bacterium]
MPKLKSEAYSPVALSFAFWLRDSSYDFYHLAKNLHVVIIFNNKTEKEVRHGSFEGRTEGSEL